MSKVILHLCADTGSDTYPYQDDPDYEVVLVGEAIGVENFSIGNWLHFHGLDKEIYGIIANPVLYGIFNCAQQRQGAQPRRRDVSSQTMSAHH
jgi:hypothetical protein